LRASPYSYAGAAKSRVVVVRQKGSHIRLQKHLHSETLKLTLPAHRPIKRSTLAHILKQARLSTENFFKLVQ